MNWFDEQIRYRQEKDDETFADAIDSIAGAVMGQRLTEALDSKEIAQSAIEEILKFYHVKMKNEELPSQITTVDEQLDFRIRPFGIMRRTVQLDHGWYKHAVGPMLGTLKEDGSAIALMPDKFAGYSYLDLKTGQRVKLNRKTEKRIEEEAVCFYKPLPMKPLTVKDLLKFCVEQLGPSDVLVYIVLMILSTLLGMLSPIFTKWLFGYVLASKSVEVLVALAVFMICFSICQLCFSAFQTLINSRISMKQDIAVQAAVMNRILNLPPSFFKEYSSGELNQRASYIQTLCSTLFTSLGATGLTSLFSLVYIAQVFVYAPALVVPSLLITLATIVVSLITTFMQMKITRERMLYSSKTSGMTYAMITGMQKIKLAHAEKRMFSRWGKQYAKEAQVTYNPPTFIKLSNTIILAISLLGSLILYYLAIESNVSVADYYAFNAAYSMVSAAFASLAGLAITFANIKPILEMAKPIMEATPEIAEGKEQISELKGYITLSHVSFRYEDSMPFVLEDFSLQINPGEYLAVVGSTGCGKSTLMRLLLGFETPQRGTVYYDGKDISRVDLRSLRRRIGAVMQDGKLFLGDIFSNITISAPQLTLQEAWEAAEIASVADDIRAMPMGMHTVISEGQGGISGGQRQRLLIARAVAPKPKILMFDEATSALDNVTQKKVSEAIDGLNCTRVVIAHRLSTIKHADRIIFLEKGKIVEDGTYDELIDKNGKFAELVARQRLDIDAE